LDQEIIDPADVSAVLRRIQEQAEREDLRVTQHAQEEMAEEEILLDDILDTGEVRAAWWAGILGQGGLSTSSVRRPNRC